MRRTILAPCSLGPGAALFEDSHRSLAGEVAKMVSGDRALHDSSLVGKRLGQLGLYKHVVPAAFGGAEATVSVRALCTIREALAYESPLADSVFAVQGLSATPLSLAGRKDVITEMVTGARVGGFALTEPEAGSDVASMRATAKRDGDAWSIDGEKVFISNVGIAQHFVVFAKVVGDEGAKKTISAFLVSHDAPGLALEKIAVSGDHPLGRLTMKGCRVPHDALLGDVGDGLRFALGTLEVFRTSVGAAALGMAWRAIDETFARVTSRVQFGQRIADFQLTQVALAEMITELEAARLLVASTARAKDQGKKDASAIVAMAKMHATEVAQRIIDRAVQLHGGMGVVSGSVVEQLYREARPLRIYEGTTEVLLLLIGSSAVKQYDKHIESHQS